MKFSMLLLFFIAVHCSGCRSKNPIEAALSSDNEKIKRVAAHLDTYRVQILFTEIHRDNNRGVTFKEYRFQVDDSMYFYPASTVKLPVALLALEKMNEEKKYHRNTTFYVEGDSVETTFAKEIEKIFAVSDNDAYNRLFEYLGQDDINNRLQRKGIKVRIARRLSVEHADYLTTKPLIFYLNDSTIASTAAIANKPIEELQLKNSVTGKGYIAHDSLIAAPKDFSKSNYLPLTALHDMMKRFFFPDVFAKEKQFHLAEDDRNFLIRTMKILPKEAGYLADDYYDSSVKFFIYGDTKEAMPEGIEIYSKGGSAYGYLTDCAYIVDKRTHKEYIITATLYVNEDGIFNDDKYEYDTIGIPFLAELGRQLVLRQGR